jgi:hypothetical protein
MFLQLLLRKGFVPFLIYEAVQIKKTYFGRGPDFPKVFYKNFRTEQVWWPECEQKIRVKIKFLFFTIFYDFIIIYIFLP